MERIPGSTSSGRGELSVVINVRPTDAWMHERGKGERETNEAAMPEWSGYNAG